MKKVRNIKIQIGNYLHQVRKSKMISLTQLSEKSGVQLATLSRIENNRMTGTVESHMAIAKVLGISLTELYRETPQILSSEVKSNIQIQTSMHGGQAYYEILTKDPTSKAMLPLIIKIEPEGILEEKGMNGIEKLIFVLEGEIEVTIETEKYLLKKDSSLYFESFIDHTIKNTKKSPAKILCVKSPVRL